MPEGLLVTEPSRADRASRCSLYRDGTVLRLVGDIDLGNWAGIGRQVAADVRSGVVALDLTEVHYFGAAGVRVVLHGYEARPSGATLEVWCAPAVHRVLRISGVADADGLVLKEQGGAVR